MKRLLAASLFLFFLACVQPSFSQIKQVSLASAADMRGAYVMLKQVADTGTGEFSMNTQQLKIFTDKYVMYAHRRSETDSMADFGIGTYKVENGKVYERMFFGASGAGENTYELAIGKRADGYSQVIHFPANNAGTGWVLSEDYANAGKKMKSPLDGAWRLKNVSFTSNDGKTETLVSDDNAKQFKLYESGHFMWANYIKNKESGKVSTAYGYGSFTLDKPNQITETNMSSTYATALIGKPVKVQLKLIGNNSYEQTIIGADGTKQVEVYERLQ